MNEGPPALFGDGPGGWGHAAPPAFERSLRWPHRSSDSVRVRGAAVHTHDLPVASMDAKVGPPGLRSEHGRNKRCRPGGAPSNKRLLSSGL